MLDLSADRIYLSQWADSKEPLVRTLPVNRFTRLASRLHDTRGSAEVELYFSQTDEGKNIVQGTVQTTLQVVCQRTLKPFTYNLHCTFDLTFVKSEKEAEELPEESDPALCIDGCFSLEQLIEDELILALPIVFRNEIEDSQDDTGSDSEDATLEKHRQPFSELKALLSRNKD